MKSTYRLFTNCFLTKGYTKYLILDTQRGKVFPINQELGMFLENNTFLDFEIFPEIEKKFYMNFLFENDLIFDVSNLELEQFPNISFEFFDPSLIYVLEVSFVDLFEIDKLIFKEFLIQHIVVQFNNVNDDIMCFDIKVNDYFMDTSVEFFSVIIDYDTFVHFENELTNSSRICEITVRKSPWNKKEKHVHFKNDDSPLYRINTPSIPLYTESLLFNPYFNRRIVFTQKTKYHFGDKILRKYDGISNLCEVINKLNKQSNFIWNINHSKIEICAECEYRNVCLNEQIPIAVSNHFIFEKECDYNPYIGKWKPEEGYKTLEECGVMSNETGFSIDHKKIAKINQELWEETE